jgi:hypothetical protein
VRGVVRWGESLGFNILFYLSCLASIEISNLLLESVSDIVSDLRVFIPVPPVIVDAMHVARDTEKFSTVEGYRYNYYLCAKKNHPKNQLLNIESN